MPEVATSHEVIRFGVFEVDIRAGELRKQGVKIKLQDQPFQVLLLLLEKPGEVVTREELQRRIWPADTFVDFDHGIANVIKRLRDALNDSPDNPRYIETLHRKGYRFIAPVQRNGSVASGGEGSAEQKEARPRWIHHRGFRLGLVLGLIVAVISVLTSRFLPFRFLPIRFWPRSAEEGSVPLIRSLAVLPLQNLSGDPAQEYFADGMTEELITELSRLKGLRVISRTSIMRYKKTDKTLPEIARELNVDAILEGSVLRSGERVRITAQLVRAQDDANVWAETYDRDVHDIFALQATVAGAVADRVKLKVPPSEPAQSKAPRSLNLKAHDAYLRALHEDDISGALSNRHGMQQAAEEHHQAALRYYRLAIEEDPKFAPAYLGLGWSLSESLEDFERGAKKAVEIDDTLSEGHRMLGAIWLVRDRNWHRAEQEFLRAIELSPSSSAAHKSYAYFLDAAGRPDEGMREWEQAQYLDPAKDHLAGAYYSRRDYNRLIELDEAAMARTPDPTPYESAVIHKTLMVAYARTGRRKESIEAFRKGLIAYNYDSLAEDLRRGYARGGYQGALREWLKGVKKEKREFPFPGITAYVHTELGDNDAVFAWLPKMEPLPDVLLVQDQNVFPNLVTLRIEPMWDPLHSDPRFDQLVRSIGFPH